MVWFRVGLIRVGVKAHLEERTTREAHSEARAWTVIIINILLMQFKGQPLHKEGSIIHRENSELMQFIQLTHTSEAETSSLRLPEY